MKLGYYLLYQTPPQSDDIDQSSAKRSTRMTNNGKPSKRRRIVDSDSDAGMPSGCIVFSVVLFIYFLLQLLQECVD